MNLDTKAYVFISISSSCLAGLVVFALVATADDWFFHQAVCSECSKFLVMSRLEMHLNSGLVGIYLVQMEQIVLVGVHEYIESYTPGLSSL